MHRQLNSSALLGPSVLRSAFRGKWTVKPNQRAIITTITTIYLRRGAFNAQSRGYCIWDVAVSKEASITNHITEREKKSRKTRTNVLGLQDLQAVTLYNLPDHPNTCAQTKRWRRRSYFIIMISVIILTTTIVHLPVLTQAPRNHFYQAEMKKGMGPAPWRGIQRQNVNLQGEPPWRIK